MGKDWRISRLLDYYGKALTEKQYEAVWLYYNEDLSLAEISENMGITRQGVRDAIKRGEVIMTEMEDKLGFLKRSENMMRAAQFILDEANELIYLNDRYGYSQEVGRRSRRIAELVKELEG